MTTKMCRPTAHVGFSCIAACCRHCNWS